MAKEVANIKNGIMLKREAFRWRKSCESSGALNFSALKRSASFYLALEILFNPTAGRRRLRFKRAFEKNKKNGETENKKKIRCAFLHRANSFALNANGEK